MDRLEALKQRKCDQIKRNEQGSLKIFLIMMHSRENFKIYSAMHEIKNVDGNEDVLISGQQQRP